MSNTCTGGKGDTSYDQGCTIGTNACCSKSSRLLYRKHRKIRDTERGLVHGLQADVYRLTIVSANLDFHRLNAISQDFRAVEVGFVGNTINFLKTLVDFGLNRTQISP